MIRNRGPHRGVTLLPSDVHASRRQAFFQLHGLDEPPPVPALVRREIGSGLVLGDPVQIGVPTLKGMNGPDHPTLLFSMAVDHRQLRYSVDRDALLITWMRRRARLRARHGRSFRMRRRRSPPGPHTRSSGDAAK